MIARENWRNKGKTQQWRTVSCPACGAPPGMVCSSRYGIIVHKARLDAAPIIATRTQKSYRPPDKPKPKKLPMGSARGIHETGWVSGNCKSGRHWQCFSLSCSCECGSHKVK